MSNKLFTKEEVEELSRNPYVKVVSPKGITYTDAFKELFLDAYGEGKVPRAIFEAYGFRFEVLGRSRITAAQQRWCKAYKQDGILGLQDSRKGASGRPRIHELTLEEKNTRLRAENLLLKAENELLKNIERAERGRVKKR